MATPELPPTLHWDADALVVVDQRSLPGRIELLRLTTAAAVAAAIRDMAVRGAPAIGLAAAYGAALAAREHWRAGDPDWSARFAAGLADLAAARPTAVNLAWALAVQREVAARHPDPRAALLESAHALLAADVAANRRMGAWGAARLGPDTQVLTHCNAGALATGGHGTALGVVREAWAGGRLVHVWYTETRPWLQGARLTGLELSAAGIPATLIVEGAAGGLFRSGRVGWLVVGADRIAANGDVANKVGTCTLAACARQFGARVMVVAPRSTIDLATPEGAAIPIEERDPGEVWAATGAGPLPPGRAVHNPAFDITPAALVDVLVTEDGCLDRPDTARLAAFLGAFPDP